MLINIFNQINCADNTAYLSKDETYFISGSKNETIVVKQSIESDANLPSNKFKYFNETIKYSYGLYKNIKTCYCLKKGMILTTAEGTVFYKLTNDANIDVVHSKVNIPFSNTTILISIAQNFDEKIVIKSSDGKETKTFDENDSLSFCWRNTSKNVGRIFNNKLTCDAIQKRRNFEFLIKLTTGNYKCTENGYEFENEDNLKKIQDCQSLIYLDAGKLTKFTDTKTVEFHMNIYCGRNEVKLYDEVYVEVMDDDKIKNARKMIFEETKKKLENSCKIVMPFLDKDMTQDEFKTINLNFQRLENIHQNPIFKVGNLNKQLKELYARLEILYGFVMDCYAKKYQYSFNVDEVKYADCAEKQFNYYFDCIKTMENTTIDVIKNKEIMENISLLLVTLEAREYFLYNLDAVIKQQTEKLKDQYCVLLNPIIEKERSANNTDVQNVLSELAEIKSRYIKLKGKENIDATVKERLEDRINAVCKKYESLESFWALITKGLLDVHHAKYFVLSGKKTDVLINNTKNKITEIDNMISNNMKDITELEKLKNECVDIKSDLLKHEVVLNEDEKVIKKEFEDKISNLTDYINNLISAQINNGNTKIKEIDDVIMEKQMDEQKVEGLLKEGETLLIDLKTIKDKLTGDNVNLITKLQEKVYKLTIRTKINKLITNANANIAEITDVIFNKVTDKTQLEDLKNICERTMSELVAIEGELHDDEKSTKNKLNDEITRLAKYIKNLSVDINIVNGTVTNEDTVKKEEDKVKKEEDKVITTNDNASPEKISSGLTTKTIVGIALGCLAAVFIIGISAWLIYKKKKATSTKEYDLDQKEGLLTLENQQHYYKI